MPAAPHDDAAYGATAAACGYTGADPQWQCCYEHELSHTLLAEARGLPYSPGIKMIADGGHGYLWQEERDVLAFQAYCNGNRGEALDTLEAQGWTVAELEQLRGQLRAACAGVD